MRQLNVIPSFLNKKVEDLNFFELFKVLNSTKHSNHSANKICRDNNGNIIAVRCNCRRKIYHPIINNKVSWKQEIIGKNIPILKKLGLENGLKRLWIFED